MQNTTTKSTNTTSLRNRFNHLKTMFYQAPLREPEFNELIQLADRFDKKMAEYALAVTQNRPCFHISFIMDVSPNCDCHGENDAPILPNIGVLASFDPVALDQACADLCLKETPLRNSQLSDNLNKEHWNCHHDHFKDNNPNIEWKATLEHAEKIGLGSREYELITVK